MLASTCYCLLVHITKCHSIPIFIRKLTTSYTSISIVKIIITLYYIHSHKQKPRNLRRPPHHPRTSNINPTPTRYLQLHHPRRPHSRRRYHIRLQYAHTPCQTLPTLPLSPPRHSPPGRTCTGLNPHKS